MLEATLQTGAQPAAARPAGLSAIPTSIRLATTCREMLEHKPIGLEGIDDLLVEDMKAKGMQRRRPCSFCRKEEAGCWSEFGGDDSRGGRGTSAQADGQP